MKRRSLQTAWWACLLLLALPGIALAQSAGGSAATSTGLAFADTMITAAGNAVSGWNSAARTAALTIFGLLMLIDFAWLAINTALGEVDIRAFLKAIVERIIIDGLFLAYIQNADTWAPAITNSLYQLGGTFAGQLSTGGPAATGVSPVSMLNTMLTFVNASIKAQGWASVYTGTIFLIGFALLITAIAFVVLTATLVVALVEAKIVIPVSILFAAFGAGGWSRGMASHALKQLFMIGGKLLGIQVMAAFAQSFLTVWSNNPAQTVADSFAVMGGALILAILTTTMPGMIAGMAGGHLSAGVSTAQAAAGVAGVAAAGGAVATGVIGGARAVGAAYSLARQTNPTASMAGRLGGAASHLATAARANAGLGGAMGAKTGMGDGTAIGRTFTGRMASTLRATASDAETSSKLSGLGRTPPASGRGS